MSCCFVKSEAVNCKLRTIEKSYCVVGATKEANVSIEKGRFLFEAVDFRIGPDQTSNHMSQSEVDQK